MSLMAPEQAKVLLLMSEHKVAKWPAFKDITQHAAEQLNLNLMIEELAPGEQGRFAYISKLQSLILSHQPDYLIALFTQEVEKQIIRLATENKVHFVSLDIDMQDKKLKKIGLPTQNGRYWIAHLAQDHEQTGRMIAERLLNLAKQNKLTEREIEMMALGSNKHDTAGRQRQNGLSQVMQANEKVYLNPVMHSKLDVAEAIKQSQVLLKAKKNINLVWTADVALAKGVYEAKRLLNVNPKHFLLGSVGWQEPAFELAEQHPGFFSFGGQSAYGAWAMVLIHDHFYAEPFPANQSTVIHPSLSLLNHQNAQEVKTWFDKKGWLDTNFRSYTQSDNNWVKEKGYNFILPL
ncbi:substrate-binding domain-containing protein [Gayadomonas joobiniege]|uniref:substrate-binding domain-containing protein n=1 Tax=Gayadomonas joobiniege TaxID=1234606 RepID=UPI000367096C|nr:substrate-binding domain-containing protein [Gayadomonas joobiniege]